MADAVDGGETTGVVIVANARAVDVQLHPTRPADSGQMHPLTQFQRLIDADNIGAGIAIADDKKL